MSVWNVRKPWETYKQINQQLKCENKNKHLSMRGTYTKHIKNKGICLRKRTKKNAFFVLTWRGSRQPEMQAEKKANIRKWQTFFIYSHFFLFFSIQIHVVITSNSGARCQMYLYRRKLCYSLCTYKMKIESKCMMNEVFTSFDSLFFTIAPFFLFYLPSDSFRNSLMMY